MKLTPAKLSGLAFIILGSFLVVSATSTKTENPPVAKQAQNQPQIPQSNLNIKPSKLYVPNKTGVLSVSDGIVFDNRWEISETGVSYYTKSSLPGYGNTVLYGHNTKEILGNLKSVKSGDTIYLVLENGTFQRYIVSETKEVKPTQIEILQDTYEPRLTIYTCSGFLDQSRFVVIANEKAIL